MKFRLTLTLLIFSFTVSCFQLQAQDKERRTTKNDIKITLLSLGSGSARFTYERAFTPEYAAEVTVGLIGCGWDFIHHLDEQRGAVLKGAFKFTLIPRAKATSWLDGFYIKPEFVASIFRYREKALDHIDPLFSATNYTRCFAIMGEIGYQLVARWFVFDVYAGLGPSFGHNNPLNYYHGFMNFPAEGHLAMTAGFRIGVAF